MLELLHLTLVLDQLWWGYYVLEWLFLQGILSAVEVVDLLVYEIAEGRNNDLRVLLEAKEHQTQPRFVIKKLKKQKLVLKFFICYEDASFKRLPISHLN